jgi:hypothetical protein
MEAHGEWSQGKRSVALRFCYRNNLLVTNLQKDVSFVCEFAVT